jgi:murein DD-endopeptidase MepM/ murein hydrolase activator NlpD
MKTSWAAAFAVWLLAAPCFAGEPAISVRPAEIYQGGIAEIRVSGSDLAAVKALRASEEIAFFPAGDGSFVALLGFDLEQRPGAVEITLRGRSAGGASWVRRATINLKAKEFPREELSVSADFDQLDRATLKRIEKEQVELDRLWKVRNSARLWDGAFAPPVPGGINSPFGLRRVINGSPRAPHTGVDMKAALGVEVVAANQGRVVLKDDFFFSGNSLVLDHGGGLYTMYFHLSEFRVEKNSLVRKGEVIGLAGMTGRVTGPHLHWGARLNGARIDPTALLEIEEGARREATGAR